MEIIRRKITKLYNWKYFPFVILTLGLIPIHLALTLGTGDDPTYVNILSSPNLLEYFIMRYNTWSARLIIEFLMISIVNHQTIWIICDIAIMVLIAVMISKLFVKTDIRKTNWFITAMMFIYPFIHMSTAGWMATTLSYCWILAIGLFAMMPIKKMLYDEKIKWYEYIFYVLALIFATNHEQMCLILLAVYLVFAIYLFIKDKSQKFLILPIVICLGSLVFILTCPGTVARKIQEVERWFPEFNNMHFFRKIELGFSSTIFEFVMKPNMVFTIFCGMLFICIVIKRKQTCIRAIAAVPFISSLIFGSFSATTGVIFPGILKIINSMTKIGTDIKFYYIKTWVPDIILGVICISIIISLYLLFDDKKHSLLMIFIILLGFGSRMIMGFSPTIWASNARTFIFMYFSFITCSIIFCNIILESKNIRYIRISNISITIIAIISLITTVMEVT